MVFAVLFSHLNTTQRTQWLENELVESKREYRRPSRIRHLSVMRLCCSYFDEIPEPPIFTFRNLSTRSRHSHRNTEVLFWQSSSRVLPSVHSSLTGIFSIRGVASKLYAYIFIHQYFFSVSCSVVLFSIASLSFRCTSNASSSNSKWMCVIGLFSSFFSSLFVREHNEGEKRPKSADQVDREMNYNIGYCRHAHRKTKEKKATRQRGRKTRNEEKEGLVKVYNTV